ncbi:hypothetical protein ABT160_33125 [Streptomyces sp. NPDC001941]|uniref:hypothetical protein n=1 Tax=Streptomyces sp. NPDC001941 TaxID=3154659 RepID=UPI003324671E
MRRTAAVLALLAALLVAAPPAGATPRGCGDTSNGQLCVDGPFPVAGLYCASYWRTRTAGEIRPRLGYQLGLKNSDSVDVRRWWGSKATRNGYVRLCGHVAGKSVETCIRSVMSYKGAIYASKWRC